MTNLKFDHRYYWIFGWIGAAVTFWPQFPACHIYIVEGTFGLFVIPIYFAIHIKCILHGKFNSTMSLYTVKAQSLWKITLYMLSLVWLATFLFKILSSMLCSILCKCIHMCIPYYLLNAKYEKKVIVFCLVSVFLHLIDGVLLCKIK